MRNYRPSVLCLLLLSASALAAPVYAQPAQQQESDEVAAVGALPASDGVFVFNVRRILTEALPRLLPADRAKDIDGYLMLAKFMFGMDLRQVSTVVAGVQIPKTITARTVPSFVVILRGGFNSEQMVADFRRLAPPDSPQAVREEQHRGRTIIIFNFGAKGPPGEKALTDAFEVSFAVLGPDMLAVGQLADVKRAIEAGEGYGRINPALVRLATFNPKALVSFAVVAPEEKEEPAVISASAQIQENLFEVLASVADCSASLELNAAGLELSLLAHTEQDDKAQPLRDLLVSLVRQLSAMVKDANIKAALDALQAERRANEVRLRVLLPRKVVAEYLRAWQPFPPGLGDLGLIEPRVETYDPRPRGARRRRRARRR